VVSASSIGAAKGGGYARYLEAKTIAPERGDYYLTPDGELTQSPGRWLADPDTLDRLGIESDSPVAGGDFISLMEGRHPGTGRFLRPEGAEGGRGGGIDVTFSAPKSVSTVWALAEPWQRLEIEAAHATAVEQTVGYMRKHVPVVRRRYSGQVVEEAAKDLIAAEYQHTTARGVAGGKAPDGSGTLTWPHSGTLIWPHPVRPATDCSRLMKLEREAADRDGITSGDVRADKKRSRPGGPVDQGPGSASWSPSSRCAGSARIAAAVAAQAA
jgi:hypothetical protein